MLRKSGFWYKFLVLVLALTLIVPVLAACDDDDDEDDGATDATGDPGKSYTLRMAHGDVPTSVGGVAADKFAEIMEARTNGRVEVETYPNGMLYGFRELEQATQTGGNDILWFSSYFLSSNIPYLRLCPQTGYWENEQHMIAFNTSPEFTAQLSADIAEGGLQLLGVPLISMEFGFFSNTKVDGAETLKDFDGLRYGRRAGSAKTVLETWAGLVGVEVAPAELVTAFQTGVFDVYSAAATSGASVQIWDLGAEQTIIIPSGGNFNFVLAMNADKWNDLPADLQDTINNTVVPEFLEFCHQQRATLESAAIETFREHMDVVIQPDSANADIWATAEEDANIQKIIEDSGAMYDLAESLRSSGS